ncbi:MAG: hypothetical protein FWD98_07815 [Defluviitaleaceae bacterium]|nr:hypothetical protein [Defluviitaleaceae bacterium]
MNTLTKTIKWEIWYYWMHLRYWLAGVVLAGAISQILPVPAYTDIPFAFAPVVVVNIAFSIVSGYFIFVFPVAGMLVDISSGYERFDRLVNRPFGMLLGVRMLLSVVVILLGMGIATAGETLMMRFATENTSFMTFNTNGLTTVISSGFLLPVAALFGYMLVFAKRAYLGTALTAWAGAVIAGIGVCALMLINGHIPEGGVLIAVVFAAALAWCIRTYNTKFES